MAWAAVIGGATALIGGAMSARAGQRGAEGQAAAAAEATAEQRRQFDTTRQDMMPWLNAGGWALDQQQNFLRGDYSAALNSPDYKAALEEGFAGLDKGATAQGNLWGGGMDADRMRLGQNLASQQIGNYYNRLAGVSNTGQTTATQLGQFGQNFANQAGQNGMAGANARASSYANSANAWGNAIGQVGGAVSQYLGNRAGGG